MLQTGVNCWEEIQKLIPENYIVHPLTNTNATATTQLPARTAWLTANHYQIFPIWVRLSLLEDNSRHMYIIRGDDNALLMHVCAHIILLK
jgi:hypothetical protein